VCGTPHDDPEAWPGRGVQPTCHFRPW